MLGKIDAELKLIIAGNHDLDLDEKYVEANHNRYDDLKTYTKVVAIMTGHLAN